MNVYSPFNGTIFEADGLAEYIIRVGHIDQSEKASIHYAFLDHQFNPYYGPRLSTWQFHFEQDGVEPFQQRMDKLHFLPFSPPSPSPWKRDKIWVPTFVQPSRLTTVDQNPSVFVSTNNPRAYRINFPDSRNFAGGGNSGGQAEILR